MIIDFEIEDLGNPHLKHVPELRTNSWKRLGCLGDAILLVTICDYSKGNLNCLTFGRII